MGRIIKDVAIGVNLQQYTVRFNNTKTVELVFDRPFAQPPIVQITLSNTSSVPPFKTDVTNFDCKLKLKNKYSGTLEVTVTERAV